MAAGARRTESIAFHDLQHGGGARDIPYCRALAQRAGSTLELGAGTGRVALELAGLTDLWANDRDEQLLGELVRRAEARGLPVRPVLGDATELHLGRQFDLILAPASLAQIIGGRDARRAFLGVIARHLSERGVAMVAIADVDEVLRECATPGPPRRLYRRGRTFVSRQLASTETEGGARVVWKRDVYRRRAGLRRSRPVEPAELTYHRLSPEDLAGDARVYGLHAPHHHQDPGDETSLGSTYCVLRPARPAPDPHPPHTR